MRRCLLLVILGLLVACGQVDSDTDSIPAPPMISLLISGSGGTTPVLEAVAPAFIVDHPTYRIRALQGSGTDGGIRALREGLINIAAMGRAASPEELDTLVYAKIGAASEVPITHPAVGLADLTGEELRAVFAGEIENWSVLGGADIPVQIFVRGDTSIHTRAIRAALLSDIEFTGTATLATSMGNMINSVETTSGAIGYASYPATLATQADVTVVAFDGVDPIAETYPGLLEIGLSYLPDQEPAVAPFVAWLRSDEGQNALRELRVVQ
jgi:phosphate transport system substrate-binding protein